MTLQELSQVYLDSCDKLTWQIKRLTAQRKALTDPLLIYKLDRQLRQLRAIRLENSNIARHLAHYYDHSGVGAL